MTVLNFHLRMAKMRAAAAVVGLAAAPYSVFAQDKAAPMPGSLPAAVSPIPNILPEPGAPVIGPGTECGEAAEAKPTPPPPPPYGGGFFERTALFGDWCGYRETLREHGITWNIYSANFYQGPVSGGLQREFDFGGRGDILLNVDGGKAGLWQGFFIDMHAETLYGQSANNLTGALLPISLAQTLPTPNAPVTALTGVKFTQALSENFVLFAGKINTLDGFNQPFTGGARAVDGFMNTALLFNPVLARTVPYTALGGGAAVLIGGQPVASLMVLDAKSTPTVSGFDTFFQNGVNVVGQVNVPLKIAERPGHQGLGFSYSNREYIALDDLQYFIVSQLGQQFPVPPRESGSWALFYMFDQAIWVSECDPRRSWGVFGNAGLSDGDANPIRWAANIGVGGSSLFRTDKGDTFGAGYFYIGASDSLRNLAPRLLPVRDEHGVEVFYNFAVTPWCHITPDLQVVTPVRGGVDTSVNLGVRAKFDF